MADSKNTQEFLKALEQLHTLHKVTGLFYNSNVDVAGNEIVTKLSLNRNLYKLVLNDITLFAAGKTGYLLTHDIDSYSSTKVYSEGDLVYYKPSSRTANLYLLESLHNANLNTPTISSINGVECVVTDEHWALYTGSVNLTLSSLDKVYSDTAKYSSTLKNEHELSNSIHEDIGEFGFSSSSVLDQSLKRIDENRTKFLYPFNLTSLKPDNVVLHGYVRKWQNGVLEYDIVFKLGKVNVTSDNSDILVANNLILLDRNDNNLYFSRKSSTGTFDLFNRQGNESAYINGAYHQNLLSTVNVYYGEISFPLDFKDLNYMIFNSGTRTTLNSMSSGGLYKPSITDIDKRLVVSEKTIIGYVDDYIEDDKTKYKFPIRISNEFVNIADSAFENLVSKDDLGISFDIDPINSLIENIGDGAFRYSHATALSIPPTVRHIGKEAFYGCPYLSSIDFYVNAGSPESISSLVKLNKDVFSLCQSLKTINVIEIDVSDKSSRKMRFSASNIDYFSVLSNSVSSLYERLTDDWYKIQYGLNSDTDIILHSTQANIFKAAAIEVDPIIEDKPIIATDTIDLKAIAKSISTPKYYKMRQTKRLLLASGLLLLSSYYTYKFTADTAIITGLTVPVSAFTGQVQFPIYAMNDVGNGYYSKHKVTALSIDSDGFAGTDITSVVGTSVLTSLADSLFEKCRKLVNIELPKLKSIGEKCFYGCRSLSSININSNHISHDAFRSCRNLISATLNDIESYEDAFSKCYNLKYLEINGNSSSLSSLECNSLNNLSVTSLSISGIKTIKTKSIVDCLNLTDLTIDISNSFIEDGAIDNCPRLSSINLVGVSDSCTRNIYKRASSGTVLMGNSTPTTVELSGFSTNSFAKSNANAIISTDINDSESLSTMTVIDQLNSTLATTLRFASKTATEPYMLANLKILFGAGNFTLNWSGTTITGYTDGLADLVYRVDKDNQNVSIAPSAINGSLYLTNILFTYPIESWGVSGIANCSKLESIVQYQDPLKFVTFDCRNLSSLAYGYVPNPSSYKANTIDVEYIGFFMSIDNKTLSAEDISAGLGMPVSSIVSRLDIANKLSCADGISNLYVDVIDTAIYYYLPGYTYVDLASIINKNWEDIVSAKLNVLLSIDTSLTDLCTGVSTIVFAKCTNLTSVNLYAEGLSILTDSGELSIPENIYWWYDSKTSTHIDIDTEVVGENDLTLYAGVKLA